MKKNIIVIAGTTESREVIKKLREDGTNIIASVATPLGAKMLEEEGIVICVGRKDEGQFREFFLQEKPDMVVDASHPFAKVVTKTVRSVCEELDIPYKRIKREEEAYDYEKIIWVANAKEAAEAADEVGGVILLTTGANTASVYAKTVSNMEEKLYIRVLDTPKSLEICEMAGIPREHIIAKMPPFSVEDNINLMREINAAVLVSKDSGKQGGVQNKVDACRKRNIPIILIQRPESGD